MNKLKGKIVNIISEDDLSIIDVDIKGDIFSSILIESSETSEHLKLNETVYILFKETEVSIGKNLSGLLSMRNKIISRIKKILKGKILTEITLDYKGEDIISIITSRSAETMELKPGDEVTGLVKTNEISIMKS